MNQPRSFDGLEFDPSDGALRQAAGGGAPSVSLRPQVARLLMAFLEAPNQVLSRETLAARVWDDDRVVDFEAGLSALIRELRIAIGEVGGDPGRIETIPRRGYRFHLVSATSPASTSDDDAAGRLDGQDRPSSPRRWLIAVPALLAALAVLAVLAAVLWLAGAKPEREHEAPALDAPVRLAVLPFVRYVDEVQQPQSELRAADAMLAALWEAELERVELIGRSSLAPYADAEQVAVRVAEDLNATLIVEGSVSEGAAGWRLDVRLLRLPGGTVIWSGSRSVPPERSPEVWTEARALVGELAPVWSGETLPRALDRP